MRSADSYKKRIQQLRSEHTKAFDNGQWQKMDTIRGKLITELNGFAMHYLDLEDKAAIAAAEGSDQ